jgi:hypothetical protein
MTRHDKWCSMMLPRLKLLRELLTEDGAIFVSIDDNEVHHLRCLMKPVSSAKLFGNLEIFQTRGLSMDFHQITNMSLFIRNLRPVDLEDGNATKPNTRIQIMILAVVG